MFFLQLRAKPTKVMEKLHIAGIFNINFVLQEKWKNISERVHYVCYSFSSKSRKEGCLNHTQPPIILWCLHWHDLSLQEAALQEAKWSFVGSRSYEHYWTSSWNMAWKKI